MRNLSLKRTPQASVSSLTGRPWSRWPLTSLLALALTTYWNLVTDLILPIATCILHPPTARLINNFTACKEQPLTVIGHQPKRKTPNPFTIYSTCFCRGTFARETTLKNAPALSAVGSSHTTQLNFGSASPHSISYSSNLFGDILLRKQFKSLAAVLKRSTQSQIRVQATASLLF